MIPEKEATPQRTINHGLKLVKQQSKIEYRESSKTGIYEVKQDNRVVIHKTIKQKHAEY